MVNRQQQIEIAERLQQLWLERMEVLLTSGDATSTDLATIARVLIMSGWTLDPHQLPQGLRDKLTSAIPDVDDFDVIPLAMVR